MQGIAAGEFAFDRFRVSPTQRALWIDGKLAKLGARAFDVLVALAERRDRVVGKDELLQLVWPTTIVEENALQVHVSALRKLFGAQVIATIPGRGYRFTAPLDSDAPPAARAPAEPATASTAAPFVGRDTELAKLHGAFAKALGGQRQFVFVSGEAGIGKSALLDAFIGALLPARPALKLAQGQCIEHYGAGEPYLPLLDAIGRLARRGDGGALVALWRRCAPTVLLQLPSLLDDADVAALQLKVAGGSGERMLRETVEAIEAAAADEPLVLLLEDLHWSDRPTVEALALLARRREPARLLVVATCRPVELVLSDHPLTAVKQELVTHGAATELTLGYLSADAVRAFVAQRLHTDDGVAEVVYRRSQGHPLFMLHLTDDFGRSAAAELPSGLRELIDAQLARLGAEQQAALEAASVFGSEFAAAGVAAALQLQADEVERHLEALARRGQFIDSRGIAEWSDATISGLYAFRHDLYRETLYRRLGTLQRVRLHARVAETLYRRLGTLQRVRLHARVAERLSAAYGAGAGEVAAAELALHFEQARQLQPAVRFRRDAAELALQRYAYREALAHVEHGLALLRRLPEGDERDRSELLLRVTQGAALLATKGFGASEAEDTYLRAQVLSTDTDAHTRAPVLAGLWNLYIARAEFAKASEMADSMFELAQRQPEPVFSLLAHNLRGQVLLYIGEPAAALAHFERSEPLYDRRVHRRLAVEYGEDPGVVCHHIGALACRLAGDPEAALRHLHLGFELACANAHPFGEAQMLWMDALIAHDSGDFGRLDATSTRLMTQYSENEFPLWLAGGRLLHGAALAHRGELARGLAQAEQGLRDWRAMCALYTPHALAVAATVFAANERSADAIALLDEALALVERTGERWYEAELWRLRGELAWRDATAADARRCFERAIEIARRQQAHSLERRAAASLMRPACDRDAACTTRPRP